MSTTVVRLTEHLQTTIMNSLPYKEYLLSLLGIVII